MLKGTSSYPEETAVKLLRQDGRHKLFAGVPPIRQTEIIKN